MRRNNKTEYKKNFNYFILNDDNYIISVRFDYYYL